MLRELEMCSGVTPTEFSLSKQEANKKRRYLLNEYTSIFREIGMDELMDSYYSNYNNNDNNKKKNNKNNTILIKISNTQS